MIAKKKQNAITKSLQDYIDKQQDMKALYIDRYLTMREKYMEAVIEGKDHIIWHGQKLGKTAVYEQLEAMSRMLREV
jgi:hypothetical protein